ncbi:MAG: thiamine-phosphate pyrophosphorylase [Candidatus Firestonebacteria bacterium]
MEKKALYRIIDANINRAREGLRVVEDIFRFCFEDRKTASELKELRHLFSKSYDAEFLLYFRDSGDDLGRPAGYDRKANKKTLKGVLLANLLRAQESARVLEEFAGLTGKKSSKFKALRFKLYDLQKRIFKKIK